MINILFDFFYNITYSMKGVIHMSLKEKVQYLIDKGFSCGQIGKICNCHPTSISKWIREEHKISTRMEESIENHLKSFTKQLDEVWK